MFIVVILQGGFFCKGVPFSSFVWVRVSSGAVKPGVEERGICPLPSRLRAWERGGPLASPRLVGSGLGRQRAQHCLLFGLGISGHPGQRLGLPDCGLTVSTPTSQFLLQGMASAPPSTGLQQGGRLRGRMTKDSGWMGPEVLSCPQSSLTEWPATYFLQFELQSPYS